MVVSADGMNMQLQIRSVMIAKPKRFSSFAYRLDVDSTSNICMCIIISAGAGTMMHDHMNPIDCLLPFASCSLTDLRPLAITFAASARLGGYLLMLAAF